MAFQSKLVELHKTVLEAETGQRGFLLTRRAEYLEPYQRAMKALAAVREQLRDLVADDKEARDRLFALQELVTLKAAELRRTVERANAGDFDGARAIVESDESRS